MCRKTRFLAVTGRRRSLNTRVGPAVGGKSIEKNKFIALGLGAALAAGQLMEATRPLNVSRGEVASEHAQNGSDERG